MKQGVVWFLAPVALVVGPALFDKMSRPKAIHAGLLLLQCGDFLIMWKIFESRASEKRVFVWFTQRTYAVVCVGCICSK